MSVAEHLFDAIRHADDLTHLSASATMETMANTLPFERAVTEHGPRVLRVCRGILGTGADADDAWSETFLAALRAWPDLDPETHHEAWLVRVASRKCIDILRGRARRAIPIDVLPERDSPPTPNQSIWAHVARLPEKQRLAIAHHYYGGLPHTETAELIGSTPAAVRRAASDGLAALRRSLNPQDFV